MKFKLKKINLDHSISSYLSCDLKNVKTPFLYIHQKKKTPFLYV